MVYYNLGKSCNILVDYEIWIGGQEVKYLEYYLLPFHYLSQKKNILVV